MEDIPLGFILILFGFFVAAIVLTAIVFKYARMQSGRFVTCLVRKSDCFCKVAR